MAASSSEIRVLMDAPLAPPVADNEWKSCCFQVDKRVLGFTVQMLVSMSVLMFSMVKLTVGDGGCFYESLVMLVVGFWLPSPSLH